MSGTTVEQVWHWPVPKSIQFEAKKSLKMFASQWWALLLVFIVIFEKHLKDTCIGSQTMFRYWKKKILICEARNDAFEIFLYILSNSMPWLCTRVIKLFNIITVKEYEKKYSCSKICCLHFMGTPMSLQDLY